MSVKVETITAETVIAAVEMGDTRFDQLLETLAGSEKTTKDTLPELFAYSLAQIVDYENNGYMNRLVKVLNPRNRSMVVTVALKCSLFKFDRKAQQFDAKRKFNDDANGQEAEAAAIAYAEDNYNFFMNECGANVWDFDTNKDKPKKPKSTAKVEASERMIKSFRSAFVGVISAEDFKAQAEIAIAETLKEMAFFAETTAKNPDMDKAAISRAYKKAQEKAAEEAKAKK